MARESLSVAGLPSEVEDVFKEFRTCEMSTLAKDGTPITWPTLPFWRPDEGRFLITTSIGLSQKAFNSTDSVNRGLHQIKSLDAETQNQSVDLGVTSQSATSSLYDQYFMAAKIYNRAVSSFYQDNVKLPRALKTLSNVAQIFALFLISGVLS